MPGRWASSERGIKTRGAPSTCTHPPAARTHRRRLRARPHHGLAIRRPRPATPALRGEEKETWLEASGGRRGGRREKEAAKRPWDTGSPPPSSTRPGLPTDPAALGLGQGKAGRRRPPPRLAAPARPHRTHRPRLTRAHAHCQAPPLLIPIPGRGGRGLCEGAGLRAPRRRESPCGRGTPRGRGRGLGHLQGRRCHLLAAPAHAGFPKRHNGGGP